MAPRYSSRPLSRLFSSGSTSNGRISTPSASTNGPAKRPIRVKSDSEYSHHDGDRWVADRFGSASSRVRVESAPQEEDEESFGHCNDNLDHIVLAINKTGKSTIGASYYVAREGVLYIMEDIECAEEGTFDLLKEDLQPTVILLSPHNQGLSQQDLRQGTLSNIDDEESISPYQIEMRPLADFKYELTLHKLSNLSALQRGTGVRFLVPGEEQLTEDVVVEEIGMSDDRGRALHISSSVNLESKVSVGCAGAIITYLQRKKASEYLHGDTAAGGAYLVLRLENFSLKNTMLVNPDTLAALQIIQPESHPNAAKQGPDSSGSKESLSVYGLFYHFARTPQGKQKLRRIFLHPSLDIEVVQERQRSVGIFSKAQNQDVLSKLSKSLTKIKNMRSTLVMLHKGIEGGNASSGGIKSSVWSSLLDFCFHVIDISETLTEVIGIDTLQLYPHIVRIFRKLDFQRLGKLMFDVVDLDESQQQRRTVVKRGIHDDLDRVKDAYDGMDEMLQQAAIESLPELELAQDVTVPALNVIYLPQLGFLVLLPIDDLNRLAEQGIVTPWERMFTTEQSAYFKTNKTRQMDADLGDIWAIICDIEIEISHDLAQKVLGEENFIIEASDLCGDLDMVLALAHGVIEYKLTRPRIVEENVIDIRNGRHLLQEMATSFYVPNDAFLVGGDHGDASGSQNGRPMNPNMLLLTGPNFSGKSVYLKQVALIVYMAQVGSFVPADAARLGMTDKILTRITTRETVSKCQSSFMIDLQQVSWALKSFTARSLLVIDEFGKGTDSCDGAGLAAGVFTHLLSGTSQIPKVVASTHFHEIFEQGLMAEDLPGLGLKQMEVKINTTERQNRAANSTESEVTYLYNVKPGRSTLSYGAQCAAMNGVPKEIVERASDLTILAAAGEDLVSACAYIPEDEMRGLEEAETVSRAFLEMDLNTVATTGVQNFKAILAQLTGQSSTASTGMSTGIKASVATS